jgi:hypothetical protein
MMANLFSNRINLFKQKLKSTNALFVRLFNEQKSSKSISLLRNSNNNKLFFQSNILNRFKNNKINVNLFSTSAKKNAIPPIVWLFAKPISKLGAMIVGRLFNVTLLVHSNNF